MATPPLGRTSKQTSRDQRSRNYKFAQLTPGVLRGILDDAARGKFEDFADLCDRMKREDDHIRAVYETRLSAVAGTRYVVEPGGMGSDLDVAFARFCEESLRGLRTVAGDWSSLDDVNLAMRLLDGIGVGFAAVELDWRVIGGAWRPYTAYWVHQRRFMFSDGWELRLHDDGEQIYGSEGKELPANKFVVHIPQSVAGYPTQTGVFHATAFPFCFKRWGLQWWLDGMERFAWPTAYITTDENATDETREACLLWLDKLTQGVNGVVPSGSLVSLLESGVKDGASWQRFCEAMDRSVSKSILGNTDSTEPSKVGAWKAVESRTGTTVHARMSLDAQCLASTYQTQIFAPLQEYNPQFAGAALPSIRWIISAERKDIPVHLLPFMTVNHVLTSMGLPPRPGAEGEQLARDFLGTGQATQQAAPKSATPTDTAEAVDPNATLNGAQVTALTTTIQSVAAGALPKETAALIILASFPLDRAQVDAMLAPIPDPGISSQAASQAAL